MTNQPAIPSDSLHLHGNDAIKDQVGSKLFCLLPIRLSAFRTIDSSESNGDGFPSVEDWRVSPSVTPTALPEKEVGTEREEERYRSRRST